MRVTVNGKGYPCRQTLGAALRFKQITGKEVSDIGGSIADAAQYMYCCVQSACRADGIEFPLTAEEFLDTQTTEDFVRWSESLQEGDGEKKVTAAE